MLSHQGTPSAAEQLGEDDSAKNCRVWGIQIRLYAEVCLVNERNRGIRVAWATEHLDWTTEQGRRVLWSDESPFILSFNLIRFFLVWWGSVQSWELYGHCQAWHEDNGMGMFLCTWGGKIISNWGQHLRILIDQMGPSARQLFPHGNYIFQEDNDSKHSSKLCRGYLERSQINSFQWLSQSPDLNPIENLFLLVNIGLTH